MEEWEGSRVTIGSRAGLGRKSQIATEHADSSRNAPTRRHLNVVRSDGTGLVESLDWFTARVELRHRPPVARRMEVILCARRHFQVPHCVPSMSRVISSSIMAKRSTSEHLLQCMRAWILLVLFAVLIGPAQVLPGLLAVGAMVEGLHTVRVGYDGEHFRLILSHERGQVGVANYNPRHNPRSSAHRHGLSTDAFCLLVQGNDMEQDHVASFATGSVWEPTLQPLMNESGSPDLAVPPKPGSARALAGTQADWCSLLENRGPPPSASLLRLLQSTVFLV